MISKTFILLASSALLAGAHSVNDAPNQGGNQLFVRDQDSPWGLRNGMGALKNALGPSQHHHHHHPGPSKSWQPSQPSGGNTEPATLTISRETPCSTLSLSRSEPTGSSGPSQWHHKPGPSQWHHPKPTGLTADGWNPSNGSHLKPYVPYIVKPNGHDSAGSGGNASNGDGSGSGSGSGLESNGNGNGSNGSGNGSSGSVSGGSGSDNGSGNGGSGSGSGGNGGKAGSDGGNSGPTNYGPSASARARLADKTKQDGMYALYGQAAANACGLDAQMPGAEITACPLESGSGWDCLNLAATLESCGGCLSIGEGQDCTLIKGAETVGCIHGKCVIGTCETGYYLDSKTGGCVAN